MGWDDGWGAEGLMVEGLLCGAVGKQCLRRVLSAWREVRLYGGEQVAMSGVQGWGFRAYSTAQKGDQLSSNTRAAVAAGRAAAAATVAAAGAGLYVPPSRPPVGMGRGLSTVSQQSSQLGQPAANCKGESTGGPGGAACEGEHMGASEKAGRHLSLAGARCSQAGRKQLTCCGLDGAVCSQRMDR